MSVRTKGGMYCPRCERPVAAERTGHAVRNTLGAALTAGLSLKTERWHCPICGGPVEREAFRKLRVPPPPEERPPGTVTVTLVHPGDKTIEALAAYRRITRASLRAAKEAFEKVPIVLGHYPLGEAERIRGELVAAGCAVEAGKSGEAVPTADGEPRLADELAKLAQLRESGALSADEFAAAKARLLGDSHG